MPEKDIKILWGRSGNKCAICKEELSLDSSSNRPNVIGEMAHIVGRKIEGGKSPRSDSILSEEDRDKYPNLILLCRNHHKIIDDDPKAYPIECLHQIKAEHELWVQDKLGTIYDSHKEAADFVYTNLIDSLVIYLNLDEWSKWAWEAGVSTYHRWPYDLVERIEKFNECVDVAVWPTGKYRIASLEWAIKNLATVSLQTLDILIKHFVSNGDMCKADKFYKEPFPNPSYEEEFEQYKAWEMKLRNRFIRFCKAANYFADEVRKNINPMFFLENGKFVFNNKVYCYSKKEIKH
ncbi:MAG: HNH endonuclease [Pseudomonadota bacterium]